MFEEISHEWYNCWLVSGVILLDEIKLILHDSNLGISFLCFFYSLEFIFGLLLIIKAIYVTEWEYDIVEIVAKMTEFSVMNFKFWDSSIKYPLSCLNHILNFFSLVIYICLPEMGHNKVLPCQWGSLNCAKGAANLKVHMLFCLFLSNYVSGCSSLYKTIEWMHNLLDNTIT